MPDILLLMVFGVAGFYLLLFLLLIWMTYSVSTKELRMKSLVKSLSRISSRSSSTERDHLIGLAHAIIREDELERENGRSISAHFRELAIARDAEILLSKGHFRDLLSGPPPASIIDGISEPRRKFRSFKIPEFNRLADLIGIIFPKAIRERIYIAQAEELKDDYLKLKKKFRTRPARYWILFCTLFHLFHLVIACTASVLNDKIIAFIGKILGRAISDWLRRIGT